MFVLRCTRKLLKRIDPSADGGTATASTTKLGDWTANLLIVRRQQLVLAVSHATLLPVLLRLAPANTLLSRVPDAVGIVLTALGINAENVDAEVSAMREGAVATTNDRRVLGSLNDFGKALEWYLDSRTLDEVALHLAETPCKPIAWQSPRVATLALFAAPALRLVKG